MTLREMLSLNIRIKKNDEMDGRRLENAILEFLIKTKILGAIVWLGIDGYGRRGRSKVHLEGLMINQPIMIETIDEREKIESLLPILKRMIGDNGFITIHKVEVV